MPEPRPEPLANYSKRFQYIWNEIPMLVTFESDWRKTKTILNTLISKHKEEFSQDAEQQVQKAAQDFFNLKSIYFPGCLY